MQTYNIRMDPPGVSDAALPNPSLVTDTPAGHPDRYAAGALTVMATVRCVV